MERNFVYTVLYLYVKDIMITFLTQGRLQAQDIAVFAREATSAPHFRILTPHEFPRVLAESSGQASTWFVDFYAPWCPPCMKLLPEFRKASRLVNPPVNFGW